MSSWKKAAKTGQRTHKERHQPESRQHLGQLEKKKDYVVRAKDYNRKQATLKLLRKRALNKNPDEFHFHMINSKLEDGIHREKQKDESHSEDQLKLMETQDLKYVAYKRNIEARKIEKMQSYLHMIDAANETPNTHIFFVDDGKEAKNFNLSKRLDTHPALIGRRTNRPKLSKLKHMKLSYVDECTLAKLEQQKHMAYRELDGRVDRERQLTIVQQKMETERSLKDKVASKPKKIVPSSKDAPPIYQWKFERKR